MYRASFLGNNSYFNIFSCASAHTHSKIGVLLYTHQIHIHICIYAWLCGSSMSSELIYSWQSRELSQTASKLTRAQTVLFYFFFFYYWPRQMERICQRQTNRQTDRQPGRQIVVWAGGVAAKDEIKLLLSCQLFA